MHTLDEILRTHGLEELKRLFESQGIDDSMLGSLTDQDLISIGVSRLGDRKKLLGVFSSFPRANLMENPIHESDEELSVDTSAPNVGITTPNPPSATPTASFLSAPIKYTQAFISGGRERAIPVLKPYLLFFFGTIGTWILYSVLKKNTSFNYVLRCIGFGLSVAGLVLTLFAFNSLTARHKKGSRFYGILRWSIIAAVIFTIYGWSQIYTEQKLGKTESPEKQAAREQLAKRKAAKIQASDKEKAEQADKERVAKERAEQADKEKLEHSKYPPNRPWAPGEEQRGFDEGYKFGTEQRREALGRIPRPRQMLEGFLKTVGRYETSLWKDGWERGYDAAWEDR